MTMSKPLFFAALFFLIVVPIWLFKLVWVIHSKKTQGVVAFAGAGFVGDQVKRDYTVIFFGVGKDTIWFNGLGNLRKKPGDIVEVRYQAADLHDARVDIFVGIWGDTLVFSGIPALILLVMFLHPLVVPWGSRVRINGKKPFVWVLPKKKNPIDV